VSPKRIVIVGDVMLDVTVRVTTPVEAASDTPAQVRLSSGGSAANLAAALVRAGHDVTYVGVAGQDLAGKIFADDLDRRGVHALLDAVEGSTGVVVAMVGADGQRSMLTDRGVNQKLSSSIIERSLLDAPDHLHVSGYTLLEEQTWAAGSMALRRARELGITTSVDVCSVAPLRRLTPAAFLHAARGATMLFANEEEALLLSGAGDVDEAIATLLTRFDEVLITRDAQGALAARDGEIVHAPARSVEVVDTTGAGDAASGAYLGARLDEKTMADALDEAMVEGATIVTQLGARD
jgi:ribokinase